MANLTNREYTAKIEQLVASIKSTTRLFEDNSPLAIERRKEAAFADYDTFANTYFPYYIKSVSSWQHQEMFDLVDVPRTINAFAGFKGLGKTTHLAIIRPIWLMLRELRKFVVIVSDNQDLAIERLDAIRLSLSENERLINDFGIQLPTVVAEDDFTTKLGCRFLALGWNQPIRGKVNGPEPPDYIVIDDFESHKAINPAIARRKLAYVREEAYGAMHNSPLGSIIWLGNLTHADSALAYFKTACETENTPELNIRIYKARDDRGLSTWPAQYSDADLITIENAMGYIGFQRNMMMNPITEGIKFQLEWFRYYDALPASFERIVTYCDPSLTGKNTSDFKAIMTLGLSDGLYYLLDCYLRKASINSMLSYFYALDKLYTTRFFMESNFWQKTLWSFMQIMSQDKGYLLGVTGVENTVAKEQRIESLTPYFEWGWILFPKTISQDLKLLTEQLLTFPDNHYDDGPDALSGAVNALRDFSAKMEYKGVKNVFSSKFTYLW